MSQVTTTDPLGSSDYKSLKSVVFDERLASYVTKIEREVPHGAALPTPTASVLSPIIVNERNVAKSRLQYIIPGESGGVTEKAYQSSVPGKFVCAKAQANTQVLASAAIAPAFKTLGVVQTPIDTVNATRATETVASFASLADVQTDDDGLQWQITDTVVAKGTAVPADTGDTRYTQTDIDCQHALLRTATLLTLSWTRTYYQTIDFTFPSLLYDPDDADLDAFFIANQRRTIFRSTFNVRKAFNARVAAKIVETVEDTPALYAGLEPLTNFITQDIQYDGTLFSLNVGNVLSNAFTLTATTNSEDTYWGYAVETLSVPATDVSTDEYLALVTAGTWVCIADDTLPIKMNFYKRRKTYIKLL